MAFVIVLESDLAHILSLLDNTVRKRRISLFAFLYNS